MPKWLKVIIILIVIFAILAVGSFALSVSGFLAKGPSAASTTYTYYTVTKRDIVTTLTGTGTLKPYDSYTITATVTGDILSADFEEMQEVNEGDILYVVDSSSVQDDIEEKKKDVEEALSSSYSSVNNLITAIKENRISPDAILVDYYGQSFIKTYPARLRELSISPKNVAYYNINSDGCLDYLILNDGTGDCHSYGVIYKHHKQTLFLSDNKTSSLTGFENVASGVAQVKYTGNSAQEIVRLAETDIDSINNKTANLNGKSYKIWDRVQCFTLQQKNYSTSASSDKLVNEIIEQVTFDTINEIVSGNEYTIKGYYDSTGIIRVIVAQKNF